MNYLSWLKRQKERRGRASLKKETFSSYKRREQQSKKETINPIERSEVHSQGGMTSSSYKNLSTRSTRLRQHTSSQVSQTVSMNKSIPTV